jgi:hypothetical protein
MPFAKDQDVIQAVAPKRRDQAVVGPPKKWIFLAPGPRSVTFEVSNAF